MEEVLRFDFHGKPSSFKRTPQGFLRVNARLSKTGVFSYQEAREYRSEEEVFRADSMESFKGAPITDLHPSEKGFKNFLTPTNTKEHIIGITESVERDGPYLKGSLIIFHEDAIKAIESGERKEISLGYKCRVETTPGVINGQAYDAIQKDIVINHVAIGPKGWGRAGPECAIRTDSKIKIEKGQTMSETINIDGIEIPFNENSIKSFFAERKKQLSEMQGRLDAIGKELESRKDPKLINSMVNARINLITKCKGLIGDEIRLDEMSDDELKITAIKKHFPAVDLKDKEQSYIEGMFEGILANQTERNDSLSNTREALHNTSKTNASYEKWLNYSDNLWLKPLTGNAQGGR